MVWDAATGTTSFTALQQRLTAGRAIARVAAGSPATYVTVSAVNGKRADIVLLTGLAHLTGPGEVAGAVVASLGPTDVHTVLVDGHVIKPDGRLAHHDLTALRDKVRGLAQRALA